MAAMNEDNHHAAQRARMLLTQIAPNFLDPKHEWQRIFAELWGTFLLVLVAAGGPVAATSSGNHTGDALLPVAPGLMVMAIIYFMGTVSGAHLNPAVTLAFAIRRNFPWVRVPGYILAQVAGGWLAALFLGFMFGDGAVAAGLTLPGQEVTPLKALIIEVVLTAALVNTILGTSSGARNIGTNGAIAVGGYIALAGMWAAPVSGASMNPVRSLAPALVCGNTGLAWVYVAGPIAGALIGVVFEWILKGPPTTAGTIAAQGTLDIDDKEE
ncbi:aquaporin [Chlorobaculum sp. MV4-Y]|uniref:MIP/aquaporin family protein n=1 Tax=Chlorobaculum sp. MV4-Y TaxID=2976335 RepID=UPI0021AFE9D6|nr:aquaporin [Chlorobaculum sp. MV4-Y]UWX56803.1 aquaporin [Chlorobaculum sp. MV4-Y]